LMIKETWSVRIDFISHADTVVVMWQNLLNYMAHMHLSLSQ
jgi:hypothetical protein